jgi:hypothetical protein
MAFRGLGRRGASVEFVHQATRARLAASRSTSADAAMIAAPGVTFTHHSIIEPDWKPAPGQTYTRDAPKARCKITSVRRGYVYWTYVMQPAGARLIMSLETWQRLYADQTEAQ